MNSLAHLQLGIRAGDGVRGADRRSAVAAAREGEGGRDVMFHSLEGTTGGGAGASFGRNWFRTLSGQIRQRVTGAQCNYFTLLNRVIIFSFAPFRRIAFLFFAGF